MQSIFKNHLDFAHNLWKRLLKPGDWAIDATCGNGWDTALLADLVGPEGGVISIDLQEGALKEARKRFPGEVDHVHFFHQSHATFPTLCYEKPIRLIVYNLGYLPGGDKGLTTQVKTTLQSVQNGLNLLVPGGCMSITCYPGHEEGAREETALESFTQSLDPKAWCVSHHRWINRKLSPSLLFIQKYII